MITVGDKIQAKSADLKSTGSSISVQNALSGDLKVQTKSGDISFVSCKNLTVKSGSGSVKKYGTGLNSVYENVKIETRGGDVSLGAIGTASLDSFCEIKTVSGNININSMVDGTITTERGKVNIETARSLVVNDNIGDVTIKNITNNLTISGRNGDVLLGVGGVINSPTVQTTTGKINVSNTKGNVSLVSSNGKIIFNNGDSENIKLKAGKGLTGKNLKGEVEAYSNRNMSLTFKEITGNVNITAGSKCDVVEVDATCKLHSNVDYYLKSTKGKKVKVYAGDVLIAEDTEVDSKIHAGNKLITITTSYAQIVLKLGLL